MRINWDFLTGFTMGAATCFVVLFIFAYAWAAQQENPRYEYVNVDNMTCIIINGDFVSCDWKGEAR